MGIEVSVISPSRMVAQTQNYDSTQAFLIQEAEHRGRDSGRLERVRLHFLGHVTQKGLHLSRF